MISLVTNIFKNKKYILFLMMFTLCFSILLILVNTNQYYRDILENGIGTKIINRKIIVINTNEETIDNIKNTSNILDYYPYIYLNCSFDDLNFNLEYHTSYEYDILKGSRIINKNEIIVPKELSDNLNKSIEIEINKTKYNLKVVGVSNLEKIIISKELLNELINDYDIEIGYYFLIADNYKFAQKNIEYFSQNGYNAFLENTDGLKEYNELQKFISLLTKFIYFIIVIIFIFIIYIIKNIFHMELRNIAILKAIGYNDLKIDLVIISKILILLLISMVMSTFLFIIAINILSFILNNDYILFSKKYQFIKDYSLLCLISVLLLIVNYISIFFKIRKVNVVKILNEE